MMIVAITHTTSRHTTSTTGATIAGTTALAPAVTAAVGVVVMVLLASILFVLVVMMVVVDTSVFMLAVKLCDSVVAVDREQCKSHRTGLSSIIMSKYATNHN